MCCRYRLGLDEESGPNLFAAVEKASASAKKLKVSLKTSGDIRPMDVAPVLAPSSLNRTISGFPMQWGFRHPTREGILVFNTRSETAEEKDLFCTSIDDRRCLIPASGYYEWKNLDKKKKTRFFFSDEDRSPIYMAGLYIRSSSGLPAFSILTMEAADSLRSIHARMPVLVSSDQMDDWISGRLKISEAFLWSGEAARIAAREDG